MCNKGGQKISDRRESNRSEPRKQNTTNQLWSTPHIPVILFYYTKKVNSKKPRCKSVLVSQLMSMEKFLSPGCKNKCFGTLEPSNGQTECKVEGICFEMFIFIKNNSPRREIKDTQRCGQLLHPKSLPHNWTHVCRELEKRTGKAKLSSPSPPPHFWVNAQNY